MNPAEDRDAFYLYLVVASILTIASLIGWILQRTIKKESSVAVIRNLNARIYAWWIMVILFFAAIAFGKIGSVILFGLVSFLAFREFITLTPTQRADRRALFWSFFILIPIQYLLIAISWYGLFSIFIPVYAFLLIPIRNVIAGDCSDFLVRTAKIQWGLLVCVYFLSYTPALLTLEIEGYPYSSAKLMFFLVFVVQISDVLQYIFGKCFGAHPIAPNISPNKTIEGFAGGVLSAALLGSCLWWITPFQPWQAGIISLIITVMGFFGGLVMSAIKRDRGVKDYGTLLPGHGGMMDRIDSLCFAAPIFFHIIRFYFTK